MLFYRRRGAPSGPASSPTMESRRILLAAYHFPPSGAVGGLRISRFARFLPEFGWRPYVLTVDDADRPQEEGTDRGRLVGLESVSITRTHQPSGVFDCYAWIKQTMHDFRGGRARGAGAPVSTPARPAGREGLVQRLRRYARSLFVLLPDEQKNWSVCAAIPAVRLIRRHRIDCILTSAPPFSGHFIGLVAKAFTRVAWVADFRDPWGESLAYRSAHSQSWLSRRLEQWMEAMVMNHADRVLCVTEPMRQSMVARFPHIGHKFSCLPNGFDLGHLALGDRPEKYDRLTITYAGTLYLDRTPEPLFAALSALVKEGKVRPGDVAVKLIGNCRYVGEVETEALARRHGVESAVEIIERLPHIEAARIMQRSHLLLVLAPSNHRMAVPAKIYDYLGSGSKLLALAPPGPTADLIRETGGGTCFSPNDVSGLKAYLHDLLTSRAYMHLRNDPELYRRWDGRSLTGQLAAMLSGPSARSDGQVVEMAGTASSHAVEPRVTRPNVG
jgi:glycosyltransferase involved in cell wall biosynthesis